VKAAARVASLRDDRVIYIEDLMFVLRKDTVQFPILDCLQVKWNFFSGSTKKVDSISKCKGCH